MNSGNFPNMAQPQQGGNGNGMATGHNNPVSQVSAPSPQIPSSGEGAQQFCLRWNSYPATVATQLAALRASDDFTDVTLACDGRQLKAHKLVLSACSPYFMQLFKSTPCQHPVIFLRDVGFRQLLALLEFMYAGEVNVSQVELPQLLRTAEALQVRGLADTNTGNNNPPPPPACPQQPSRTEFSPQYGQLPGPNVSSSPLPPTPQNPIDQNSMTSIGSSQSLGGGVIPSVSAPSTSTANSIHSTAPAPTNKREKPIVPNDHFNKPKDDHESIPNQYDMLNTMNALTLDHSKDEMYMNASNAADDSNDTGQVFDFDLSGDGDGADGVAGNENENNSEEESSEEMSDDDNGECGEFTYQSDASYNQEGNAEGEENANGEVAGPSSSSLEPNSISLGKNENNGPQGLPPGPGRNRLSRSLWPPGIPYHGPQQCPYCTRILSNVGNWRKHVLTMHFAREKVYKCRHCTSSFRTQEYLQKHYVRVHNYPQKMTRRKYVEQT